MTSLREQLPGTVKFIFQPAEEGPPKGENGGAKMMVQQGVLKDPDVDAIFGLHISQGGLAGTANYRPKGAMASAPTAGDHRQGQSNPRGAALGGGRSDHDRGGHRQRAADPSSAAKLTSPRRRRWSPWPPSTAGVRNNIIPDTARLTGTIRTYDAEMRTAIHQKIRGIAANTAASMGAEVEVFIDEGVPVTYNDPDLAAAMAPTLERVYGAENVSIADRITGAEDFSVYQEQVPGLFFFIGGRPADIPAEKGHSQPLTLLLRR